MLAVTCLLRTCIRYLDAAPRLQDGSHAALLVMQARAAPPPPAARRTPAPNPQPQASASAPVPQPAGPHVAVCPASQVSWPALEECRAAAELSAEHAALAISLCETYEAAMKSGALAPLMPQAALASTRSSRSSVGGE